MRVLSRPEEPFRVPGTSTPRGSRDAAGTRHLHLAEAEAQRQILCPRSRRLLTCVRCLVVVHVLVSRRTPLCSSARTRGVLEARPEAQEFRRDP